MMIRSRIILTSLCIIPISLIDAATTVQKTPQLTQKKPEQTELREWMYVDFDVSMRLADFPQAVEATRSVIGIDGHQLITFFRQLYDKNNLSVITPRTKNNPKIIWQIWIGGPVPEVFKPLMQTVRDMHPDYEYHLITDDNYKEFLPHMYNQAFFDESDNPGVRSDLLKWELVFRWGGIYVDMDFEIFRSVDIIHQSYDFWTGIQPLDSQFVQLGAALFGGMPGHPILKHCIETIKDDWHKKGAPTKSGPVHFTRSFFATAGMQGTCDIALPAGYLYPLGCRETELQYDQWLANGSYAIHHWAKSWMPPQYRKKEFRKLDNDTACVNWNE